MSSSAAATQKPICTICYEDLKPIAEDLQSIPVCGHVFHELCLQQWLEYCPAGKKPTCPVCKQSCERRSLSRLYFQSTGDVTQTPASSQNHASEADAQELAEEVRRLELKLSSLTANFENQQMHLKRLNDEVSAWKETAKREEIRREEIEKEKEHIGHSFEGIADELRRKTVACAELERRSLGLAKELAALKLYGATDVNLGEAEMVKLASIGHGSNHESAVEVLKKSLAIRNKNYKELMVQCNLLGRAEARKNKKLDKAKEKIKALKTQLQQLEKVLEEKENGILRDLKASKKLKAEEANLMCIRNCGSFIKNYSLDNQPEKLVETAPISKMTSSSGNGSSPLDICVEGLLNDFLLCGYKDSNCVIDLDSDTRSFKDEDAFQLSPNFSEQPTALKNGKYPAEFCKNADIHEPSMFEQGEIGLASASLNLGIATKNREGTQEAAVDKSVTRTPNSSGTKEILLIDDITKQTPAIAIKKEAQAYDSVASPAGGIYVLEGAQRNVGKWCKQASSKASSYLGTQASKSNGDLIAVGADGRGGRVKVLRSHDQYMGRKAQAVWPKRKFGAAQSGQSQIEHFFGSTKS